MRLSTVTALFALVPALVFVTLGGDGTGPGRRAPKTPATVKADTILTDEEKLVQYMDAAQKPLDARMRGALGMIEAGPRRMLALKFYLGRGGVGDAWAWSESRIAAFRKTIAFRVQNAEVDLVRREFARRYRGYELTAQKDARTLADQVQLWNTTPGILVAGQGLWKQALAAMKTPRYPDTITSASAKQFRSFLQGAATRPAPTVALPGFSHHGQLRAYDFVIWQGGRIVAGTDITTIHQRWIASGWSDRLRQAVYAASSRFDGPLQSPHEPWHYTYLR